VYIKMANSAREQILEVAGRLFFQHGYRAIGIDLVIAEAGVAKATLYRHFPSKDDLIAAYLEDMNRQFWVWFEEGVAEHPNSPREGLVAVFYRLQKLVTTPTCWGCPFLMAVSEFPSREHRGHQVAVANKLAVRARLLEMAQEAGIQNPSRLANQLHLMMDGAWSAARVFSGVGVFGVENPAADVGEQAEALIRGA
jgi:AcrR family transcriptional regulator